MIQRYLIRMFICLAILMAATLAVNPVQAQDQTVGVFVNDSLSWEGYTLFGSLRDSTVYLIDNYGREVHSWETSTLPNASVYLLENGLLLRTSQIPGETGDNAVDLVDWDGNILWHYVYDDSSVRRHHDVEIMPNGNVLILAYEFFTREEAIAAGRDSTFMPEDAVWPEHIVEVEPVGSTGGNIVWEWHVWDHLIQDHDATKNNYGVVEEHPELIDINFSPTGGIADWIHANAIEYNPQLDQIVISSRSFSEIWIIDHSTTTAEAASHSGGNSGMGGDLLYRWGNPAAYRAPGERTLHYQHDAQWIPPGYPGEGNLLIFDNGTERGWSSVVEIEAPMDGQWNYVQPVVGESFGPADYTWEYTADTLENFFSWAVSGCSRMPNGNTVVCSGIPGRFFEVTPAGEIVWEYENPITANGPVAQGANPGGNAVFRCYRYTADYPGLAGRDLTPGLPLEINPVNVLVQMTEPETPTVFDSIVFTAEVAPVPDVVSATLFVDDGSGFVPVAMSDDGLHHDGAAGDGIYGASVAVSGSATAAAYYFSLEDDTGAVVMDPPGAEAAAYRLELMPYICGDANGDGSEPVVSDLVYMVDYLFRGGPAPSVPGAANVNNDGGVTVSDVTYLVDYLFRGGPAPQCLPL